MSANYRLMISKFVAHIVVNDPVVFSSFDNLENVLNSTIDFSADTPQNDNVFSVLTTSLGPNFDGKSGVLANNAAQSKN